MLTVESRLSTASSTILSPMGSITTFRRPLHTLPPTETLEIGYDLSLTTRLKLLLTFFRSDPAVKPFDEWQIKTSLLHYLRSSLSLNIPDEDLVLQKRTDLHKRKRDEPVASGTLYIRDLGFLKHKNKGDEEDHTDAVLEKKYLDWKRSFVDRMGGIELNLEGVKFRMTVDVPISDEFEAIKKSWEDHYGSYFRGEGRRPDTIIVQGVPSRWFAEPRVSSKPSMLNTHTIFSALGKIRNLYITGADDIVKNTEGAIGDVVPGLQCKVWVQFESYDEFSNAVRVLCGRSMQKQGSRLKVDYEVTWDKDIFFRNLQQTSIKGQERYTQVPAPSVQRNESPKYDFEAVRSGPTGARVKRFRDSSDK